MSLSNQDLESIKTGLGKIQQPCDKHCGSLNCAICLKEVIESLLGEIERLKSVCVGKESYRQVLEESQRYRTALEKYADPKNWDDGGFAREEAKIIFCEFKDRAGYTLAKEALMPREGK